MKNKNMQKRRSLRLAWSIFCTVFLLSFMSAAAVDLSELRRIAPAGGERIEEGETFRITWDTRLSEGRVSIKLWNADAGKWTPVVTHIEASRGSYVWFVPQDIRGDKFRVKVERDDTPDVFQISPAFFTIGNRRSVAADLDEKHTRRTEPRPTLSVQPLPSTEIAIITTDVGNPADVSVVSMAGEIMRVPYAIAGSSVELRTQGLPSGIYIAKVRLTNGQSASVKVVVSR